MSSEPTDRNTAQPAAGYPAPTGSPAPGAHPPAGFQAPGAPGQPPYPPAGYPPPLGAYPGYPGYYPPPPPQGYYPPYGGYPAYGYPGYPPPPGPPGAPGTPSADPHAQTAAPGLSGSSAAPPPAHPGQPTAPTGAYPPPSGPPPPGAYPPPPTGHPAYGSPYYPPPPMPGSVPGFPAGPPGPAPGGYPGYPGHQATPGFAPPPPGHSHDPLVYLGVAIPDPSAHAAAVGVEKVKGYDPARDYALVASLTRENTTLNDTRLLPLAKRFIELTPFEMDALRDYAIGKNGVPLADRIDTWGLGYYCTILRGLTLGPLGYDVELINKALAGFGTNETILMELLLCRPGHEIRWLKTGYKLRYGRDLVDAVKSDLSGKLERLYIMALNAQKPTDYPGVMPDQTKVAQDVEILATAAKKRDEGPFFEVLVNRSDGHLASVITAYATRYKSLSKIIKKTFSGNIEAALLFIVHGVKAKRDGQGIWRDAKLMEKSMAGLGTKDQQLVYRILRAHWSHARMKAIKEAYQRRYNKTLDHRVKGETSGPYRDALLAILREADK
ncbi:hypothetical protein CPB83DRAFT_356481 [Crepidotus variabilis]|uniref:Annexin n=1 Tax=Crepidotus variabilis TaxID=179855 RepID=A0A9P6EFT0_9AGAR|nr:hypothetical protein CPB83DRAFT_356481 [Crepidotus variabilis]